MAAGELDDMPLAEMFREELDLQAGRLAATLAEMAGSAPADAARLEALALAAHSLRGAGKIVGFDAAVRLSHEIELCAGVAQKGRLILGPGALAALSAATQLLSTLGAVPPAEWRTWSAAHEDEIAALAGRLAGLR